MVSGVKKLGIDFSKVLVYNKTALIPTAVICSFILYFFSISEFSEDGYRSIHFAFLAVSLLAFISAFILRVPNIAISVSVIYVTYIVINSMRYSYGEDYIFSSGYNIWNILVLPNLMLVSFLFPRHVAYKYWSWFYIFLLLETSVIEKLQNQSLNADSYFFYKHIGMMNYPAFYISLLCIFILFVNQIAKGKILNVAALCTSIAVFLGMYHSDNLYAFSLFFLAAAVVELCTVLYYAYYIQYKDEELNISNLQAFYKEADNQNRYPLKYCISLMYIDDYERLVKRFGAAKILQLKKMFIIRIHRLRPNVLLYNYRPDAFILTFKNYNASECFDAAEEIRRMIAKSIFIFNENNHLQLTISQCISEKKRSDANASVVLGRAKESLNKACKFTHNITIRA